MLERVRQPVAATLEHLVGLQAQVPRAPHVALWSRLAGYDPADLDALMTSRAVVRTQLMRTTIHTVTASDALALRPLLQPVLDRTFAGTAWGQRLRGRDVGALVAEAADLLAARPMGRAQLQRELAERHPGLDAEAVVYGVSYWLPWVQPPPRGLWRGTGAAVMIPVRTWLGGGASGTLDHLVVRYLAAFGPASVRDVQVWCGLTRLREVVDRLGPRLRRFRTEDGMELFDVHGAPLPDPDTPAPVRFLPEYDNVLLSHADRTRIVADGHQVPLPGGSGGRTGTVLVDGMLRGSWSAGPDGDTTVVTVRPSAPLSAAERDDVEAEGGRLLGFLVPGSGHDVRFGDA